MIVNESVKYLGGEMYADGETWRSCAGVLGEWEAVFVVRFSRRDVPTTTLVSVTREWGDGPTEHDLRYAELICCGPRARDDWEETMRTSLTP